MRKSVSLLVIVDLMFLILAAARMIPGAAGYVAYYALYALLIGLTVAFVGRGEDLLELRLLPRRPMLAAALFAPTMLLIVGISFLSGYLLSILGKTNATDVSGPLAAELLRHALLPALLEEMLFRYIPVRLLGRRSPRAAITVSAVLFALIHLSLFQIPYALAAGVVLAYMTLLTGSVLPAILLHLVNNVVSVLWMRDPETAAPIILAVLALTTVLSVAYIVLRRRDYRESLMSAFSGEKVGFSFEMLVIAVLSLGAALLELR